MKTVLVAVDGSEPALRGVVHAAEVARAVGATLELVYVSFPDLLPPQTYARLIAELKLAESRKAEQIFVAAERSIAEQGLRCARTHRTGGAAEEIATLAEREDVWAVVVGARGHNALSRVLLGSVADRLVHICPKPVLVVR
ncbi:MAG: universal stress protein [Archangiaceae bacterium]|nr:universal stress protein [Archangiaceae bacterium]